MLNYKNRNQLVLLRLSLENVIIWVEWKMISCICELHQLQKSRTIKVHSKIILKR